MDLNGGFYIGSYGLGVHTEDSDRDIVVTKEMFEGLCCLDNLTELDIRNYLCVLKNERLFKGYKVDIIVVNPTTFEQLKKAMLELSKIDKEILKNKNTRIAIFEALVRNLTNV